MFFGKGNSFTLKQNENRALSLDYLYINNIKKVIEVPKCPSALRVPKCPLSAQVPSECPSTWLPSEIKTQCRYKHRKI